MSDDEYIRLVNKHDRQLTELQLRVQSLHEQLTDLESMVMDLSDKLDKVME